MRYFGLALLILAGSLAMVAQDTPKAQIFGGFSYANYELLAGSSPEVINTTTISGSSAGRLSVFGWNGAFAANVNPWFGIATDFSGYYSGSSTSTTSTETFTPCSGCTPQTITTVNTASSPKIYNFLFGPQFSYPSGKIRPFGRLLAGLDRMDVHRSATQTSSNGIIGTGIISELGSSNGFAMAFGGGVDYSIKHHLAWRLAADYLTGQGSGQNHVRVSTGIVWRLGS